MAAALAFAATGLGLNVAHALLRLPAPMLENLPPRFWQDLHMAEAFYLFDEFPVTANEIVRWRGPDGVLHNGELHPHLEVTTEEAGIRPWEFWRVVRENRYRRPATRALVTRYDDAGRPILLGLAFRARGGIAPFLFFWLGPLMAIPVLAWAAGELTAAGAPVAGIVLLVLLGAWPFFADTLALAYSTAGFNVLAIIATLPLAVYAGLHPAPRAPALLAKAAVGGIVLAACVIARGGALQSAGGMVLALATAAWRIPAGGRPRAGRVSVLLAGVLLLAAPLFLARAAVGALARTTAAAYGQAEIPPQRHALWFGIWTGLGDFDRTKGYQWLDGVASNAAVAAGGVPLRSSAYDPVDEPIFRRLVLADVRADPWWYAGILARRLAATVSQRRLWPWPPVSGRSLYPAAHAAEGAIDSYYSLATPPDRFGIGAGQVELPIPLLVAPAVAIAVAAATGRRRGRGAAFVLAALAVSTLPLPVLVTTASAIETEAFMVVYVVAAALALGGGIAQRQEGVAQAR